MQREEGGRVYEVLARQSFEVDWSRGVEEGWINPMADPTTLQAVKQVLSRRPRSGARILGEPDNVMAIRFPRSARSEQGRLEISYEILEDDRTVWLEDIRPVG